MKKVIWKIELNERIVQDIELRHGYEFLDLQMQNGKPCIWVLLNPNERKLTERFEIYGTGHTVNYDDGIHHEYLRTFQEGGLVWHLFKYTRV